MRAMLRLVKAMNQRLDALEYVLLARYCARNG